MSFENLSGQMLGSYELRELLGQGGMGAVYRAVQANLKRDVAIKILPTSLAQQSGYLERFNREAEIAAALQHPHIVPIIDYGMQRGISYVVMRYLSGGSLAQRINQRLSDNGPLPSLGEVVQMLNQLASALDYAHSQGVIHRDIKTSNIMFDNQGNAYVVDFGIAKLQGASQNLTSTGVTLGTTAYMPPEQWRSEALTPAADQYAMAVVIYILLTGRIPYESDTPGGLMYKHFNETPIPPEQFRADVPASVGQVINRALAKKPEDRYPNMAAFANAFQKAIAGHEGEPNGFFTFKIRGIPLPAPITPPSPPLGTPPASIRPSVDSSPQDDSSTVVQPTPPPIPPLKPLPPLSQNNNNRVYWGIGSIIIVIAAIAFMLFNRQAGGTSPSTATHTETSMNVAVATPTPVTPTAVSLPPSSTATDTLQPSPAITVTPTPTASFTATVTASRTATAIDTATATSSSTLTATSTKSPTPTATATETPSPTATYTPTPTVTASPTPTVMATATYTPTTIATPEIHLPGRIVFTTERSTNPDIAILDPSNPSHVEPLTYTTAIDSNPVWSRDGRRIAFTSNRDGNFDIYGVSADGGLAYPLTTDTNAESNPTWSPDGKQIAFNQTANGITQIKALTISTNSVIQISPNNDYNDYNPTWSPDGSDSIAFESVRAANRDIFSVGVYGIGATNISHHQRTDIDPAWSPDGEQIAFASNRSGNFEIYVTNADGSNTRRLTHNDYNDEQPTWSPDGQYIAFVSDRSGNRDIWVMSAIDGEYANMINLTADSKDADYDPDWGGEPNTNVAPTPTVAARVFTLTTTQGVNVRSGPSTLFNPPIGSLPPNQTVDLLARSSDGQWFKIKYYNGEGWIFGAYTEPSVDVSQLPIDAGTPLPTLSPTPPTIAPTQTIANLVVGNINIVQACGSKILVSVDVANLGQSATIVNGSILIQDFRVKSGEEVANSHEKLKLIQPGQTINFSNLSLTVINYPNEVHRLVVTINQDRFVPETSYDDNSRTYLYTLQPSSPC